MKLELTDKLLYTPTIKFDFYNPPIDPKELVDAMAELMCDKNGIGLSANQCGLPWSVFIIGNPENRESIIPVFNPMIVSYSDEEEYAEEGCLSFPGYQLRVKRPIEIRIRMSTVDDQRDTARFTGLTSRVVQHEMQHLRGEDFRKSARRLDRERADKKYKQWLRRQKKVKKAA